MVCINTYGGVWASLGARWEVRSVLTPLLAIKVNSSLDVMWTGACGPGEVLTGIPQIWLEIRTQSISCDVDWLEVFVFIWMFPEGHNIKFWWVHVVYQKQLWQFDFYVLLLHVGFWGYAHFYNWCSNTLSCTVYLPKGSKTQNKTWLSFLLRQNQTIIQILKDKFWNENSVIIHWPECRWKVRWSFVVHKTFFFCFRYQTQVFCEHWRSALT